jgi:hypothetical protein
LAQKLVAGKTNDLQSFGLVIFVELDELFVVTVS